MGNQNLKSVLEALIHRTDNLHDTIRVALAELTNVQYALAEIRKQLDNPA